MQKYLSCFEMIIKISLSATSIWLQAPEQQIKVPIFE